MRANRTISFQLENFEEFGGFENMPKGELFRFSVNPFNGKVVLTYQDSHVNGSAVVESVINQLQRDLHLLAMSGSQCPIDDFASLADSGELKTIRSKAAKVTDWRKREKAAVYKVS